MAVIKVFDSSGVRLLQCFDTLVDVPYIEDEKISATEDSEAEE